MNFLFQYLSDAARQCPTKEAVIHKKQSINYEDLDRASSLLANTLAWKGVERGDRIAIYLSKSIESVISIYGILKAGAAYVPVDPVAPMKRVEYILSNCGVICLITDSERVRHFGEDFLQGLGMKLVLVTGQEQLPLNSRGVILLPWNDALSDRCNPVDNAALEDSEQLAYILYTSGSTGSPKGVMLSHRNGMAFVDWAHRCFQLNKRDRIASHAPFHFDLSIFDLFASAKAGATLVLVPESQVGLGGALVKFISDNSITVWYSVPSALIRMLEATNYLFLSSCNLRLILFAGEVFPIKHLRKLYNLLPGVELYNLYGPTETNVCTFYRVMPEDVAPEQIKPVPIGEACEYAYLFTIDEAGKPISLSCGGKGHLCIAGESVMLGYWGDSVRTANALIECPRAIDGTEKAYLSGDLVTQDTNRNYVFVGRRDHMVKIRGYRVELGEIESALLSHQSVHEVAVVSTTSSSEEARLVAYILLHDAIAVSDHELAQHCLAILPRYMMPEQFKFLGELPKTSTGKIDRRKLIEWSME